MKVIIVGCGGNTILQGKLEDICKENGLTIVDKKDVEQPFVYRLPDPDPFMISNDRIELYNDYEESKNYINGLKKYKNINYKNKRRK